jgi:hypothetical protein
VILSNELECDEAYVIAGHKGQPAVVKHKGRTGQTPPTHPLPLCEVKLTLCGVEPLYAVCTNSKSHNCCVGESRRSGRRSAWGRYTTNDSCGFNGMSVPCDEAKRVG